jgi:putative DNA primase/helicase
MANSRDEGEGIGQSAETGTAPVTAMKAKPMATRTAREALGGPNHDRHDRSLCVRFSAGSPDGFICHSFAGDDFKDCRDYVAGRLGIDRQVSKFAYPNPQPRNLPVRPTDDEGRRIERARAIWAEAVDPRRTVVETYWRSRALDLDDDLAGPVLRFHPACPWRDKDPDKTIFVPAMVAAMRSIATDQITAVH